MEGAKLYVKLILNRLLCDDLPLTPGTLLEV
jgi:hypothetical protein